jgi:hypothetical protein
MYDAIDEEKEYIDSAIEVEHYMKKITQDAHRQGSITDDEYDTIMRILSRKLDMLGGADSLLNKLSGVLDELRYD